jgi:hypothetical protein
MIAIIAIVLTTLSLRAAHQRQVLVAAHNAEVARNLAKQRAHLEGLRGEIPGTVEAVNAALGSVAGISTPQEASVLHGQLTSLKAGLGRFNELQPQPVEIGKVASNLEISIKSLEDLQSTYAAATEAMTATRNADELVTKREWIEADDLYAKAIELWSTHPDLMSTIKMPDANGKQATPNPALEKVNVEAKRLRIAARVAGERARLEAARKREAKEEADQAAFAARCGAKPNCGGFHDECIGIENALKRTANDPSSIEVSHCIEPVLTRDHCWVTTCDVRGKNGFGALILLRKQFSMSRQSIQEF